MPTPNELKTDFWSALKSDKTVMLGLAGVEHGHTRPMTARIEGDTGPIWFFGDRDTELVKSLDRSQSAVFSFSAKDHDLFAAVDGVLQVDMNRAVIDRLWNSAIAAWYKGGKDDPRLALLRFDPGQAEIWQSESSLFAGVKALLGVESQTNRDGKKAEVSLATGRASP